MILSFNLTIAIQQHKVTNIYSPSYNGKYIKLASLTALYWLMDSSLVAANENTFWIDSNCLLTVFPGGNIISSTDTSCAQLTATECVVKYLTNQNFKPATNGFFYYCDPYCIFMMRGGSYFASNLGSTTLNDCMQRNNYNHITSNPLPVLNPGFNWDDYNLRCVYSPKVGVNLVSPLCTPSYCLKANNKPSVDNFNCTYTPISAAIPLIIMNFIGLLSLLIGIF